MAAKRTEMDRLLELVRLHRMGTGYREVARLLRMGPNTERDCRQALLAEGLLAGPADDLPDLEVLRAAIEKHLPSSRAPQQESTIEAWATRIAELVAKGLGPRATYDRLFLEDPTFRGSPSAVKRMVRRIRRARGVQPGDVAIPIETAPGQEAQVDFGYVGRLFDPVQGVLRKAWCFVMVLAYSRHMVVRIAFDQRTETWLRLHAEAFAELDGVIATVVPDNLKSAVVRAAFGIDGTSELNRSYRDFARHYGFKIDPTPAYEPKKKGKVERGVRYVKGNFFVGRAGEDVEILRPELARWVREVAGRRVHGTTGKRPLEVFDLVERETLRPLPARLWEPIVWKKATVHRDCHVIFDKRIYSVPWRLVGKEVWVRATSSIIDVYADDVRVATHDRKGKGYRSTKTEHLPEGRGDLRHRSRAYWETRADKLGVEVGALVRDVFDSDDVLSQLRAVQAIVTHLESFPPERARAAAKRAKFYGVTTYRGVKNILRQGLDLEPLPVAVVPSADPKVRPRFARDVRELVQLSIPEVNRESH